MDRPWNLNFMYVTKCHKKFLYVTKCYYCFLFPNHLKVCKIRELRTSQAQAGATVECAESPGPVAGAQPRGLPSCPPASLCSSPSGSCSGATARVAKMPTPRSSPRPAPGLPPVNPSAHGIGGPGMVTDKKMGKKMKKAQKKTHKCHENGQRSPSCSSSEDSDRIQSPDPSLKALQVRSPIRLQVSSRAGENETLCPSSVQSEPSTGGRSTLTG